MFMKPAARRKCGYLTGARQPVHQFPRAGQRAPRGLGSLRRGVAGPMMIEVHPNSVLITGTTSGVGRVLLEHYAKPGVKVIAVNRRRVAELESRYPSVRFECVDVRCAQDVADLVRGLAASGQLPEVFILNAGINRVDNDESFDLSLFREVIDTNLYGVLNFVGPLTQISVGRMERHVVAISSMASYAGNPYGLGYTMSKKALTACFEVWSKMYAGTDLVFQHRHDGGQVPGVDGLDQEPLLRIGRRHRAVSLAVCPDPQEEAVLSVVGASPIPGHGARPAAHPRFLPRAQDA